MKIVERVKNYMKAVGDINSERRNYRQAKAKITSNIIIHIDKSGISDISDKESQLCIRNFYKETEYRLWDTDCPGGGYYYMGHCRGYYEALPCDSENCPHIKENHKCYEVFQKLRTAKEVRRQRFRNIFCPGRKK